MIVELAITAATLKCLTTNAYHEARGESAVAIMAVTHVVLNRTKDTKFPNTPCSVVHQKRNKNCQFSWVCDKIATSKRLDLATYMRVKSEVLTAIKLWNNGIDVTSGALFYHANYVKPTWSKQFYKTVTIDQHIFYRMNK
jgi:spore germination cell wall hydrolase CwlJ-like protein